MKKLLLTYFLLIFTQIGFGQNNYSLSFDGYGDYVDLGNDSLFDFQYGDPFTISMWIYPSGLGGDKGLISKMADNGPVQYELITSGTSIRYGTGNQFLFGGQLEVGNWYHLIVTSDGSVKNIYINNQLIESGTFESMTSNGDNLYIGAHQPLAMPGWSWSGFIDEVSIWNVDLAQNEIDTLLTNGLNGNENGLISYYKFNQGAGGTLLDDGPNGINGSINGATWSTEVPILPVLGCTDSYAENYNADANVDDGSCSYPESGDFSLDFDGNVNAVDINVYTFGDYTVSGWFNYDIADDGNCIVGSNSSDYIRIVPSSDGSDQRVLGYNSPTGANHRGEIILSPGTWYHFAVSRLDTNLSFYINGELDKSFYEPSSSLNWVKIGLHRNGSQHGFDGLIDGISIWKRSFEQSEIQDLISNINFQSSEGLQAAYSFNSGSGEIAFDRSGNAKHGLINGPNWSDSVPYNGPFYVSTEGSDANQGSEGSPFATIQKAINSSIQNGNEIFVHPGVYQEKLLLENKELTIRSIDSSEYDHDSSGVVNANVVIEGPLDIISGIDFDWFNGGVYDGTVITINGGSYHLDGLRIRNGIATSELTINNFGGGIKLENAELVLSNCLVDSNWAVGPDSKGGGIHSYNSRLYIERSTINNNEAYEIENFELFTSTGTGKGAGIYSYNSRLYIERSIINNNQATDSGGGVYFETFTQDSMEFYFLNSVMSNNRAISGGGLFMSRGGMNSYIENSIIDHNSASYGGGIYCEGSFNSSEQHELHINNSKITHNNSVPYNYSLAGTFGDGVTATDYSFHMEETSVLWNSGFGLNFRRGHQSISNSIIANNSHDGIAFSAPDAHLEFCTIANNSYGETNSCGIFADALVANNSFDQQVHISNSIVYGNSAGSLCTLQDDPFDVYFSNIEGGYIGEGNISSDPLFCDADGGNFELAQNSPSILSGSGGTNMGAEGVGCSASYINNALSFDGSNYVDLLYTENVQSMSMSVSAWVKLFSIDNEVQIVSKYDGSLGKAWNLCVQQSTRKPYFNFRHSGGGNRTVFANTSLSLNEWYHVTGTWDGENLSIYLNGQLEDSQNESGGFINSSSSRILVGASDQGSSGFIHGNVDEVYIWDFALNQEDIQANMNQELIGYEQGLIGYWNFNNVQDSIAIDITGNGYDGIIYGAQISGDAAPIDPPPTFEGCNDPYAENYDPHANSNDGSCIYSNEPVTFIKEDYADPFMEENQDRITANVWITRGDNNSLYNAAFESFSDHDISPIGTIWASGQTALQTNLNGYKSFREATGGNHRELPGRVMSMYIIEENIFYDVEFHSWTSNNNGGGFSYTRTLAEINSFDYGADAVYFEKEDYADWSDSYNQDRITDRTWITRDNQQGIFNAFSEESYHFNSGDSVHSAPSNTLWAFGRTNEVSQSDYKPFKLAVQDTISMIDLPGHIFSLFLITEDLYYDVEFHSWTSNGNGGGFSYTRTDQYGNSVTFIKEDYADHSLEQNQDRISDGVWITRSEQHPLINYAQEQNYYDAPILYMNANGSPENTEWAFGRTEDLSIVDYQPWQAAIGGQNPRGAIGQFMSLHLIEEDIYFDVVFHSWTCCGDGGGFSYTRIPVENDVELLNGSLSGRIYLSSDSSFVEGAHIVAVAEDNSYSADTFSDSLGYYSLDLIGSANYFVSVSFEGFSTYIEYMFIAPFEETELDISLDIMQSSIVEGVLTDWYSNAPLVGASVLFAYANDNNETETIESITDEDGYFMNQVPGEKDYDLFAYADGYWVEHDAFYLNSGEHQVLEISIAEMSAASRLYGTVKDFETGESIPYAEVQLNCEEASDWDRIGALGTYRVFSYYPDDCADGVLIVTADGFETSVQSVGNIEFEAGSSFDLDIALVQGNDPDPGMLSGTVYSNIDGSELGGAEIVAYNINTTQLFTYETSDDGSFELFLPESDYLISVSVQNHSELFDSLSITSGQLLIKDFYLDQVIEYRISGVVTDQNENPLSGFETFVTNGNGYRTTYTNENGEYELYVPNGIYDVGSGSNDYFIDFIYGVEVNDNDIVVDITLDRVQEFNGGFAGLVHLNNGDSASVLINVWDDNLTYNAYVSSDANGGFALPLVNGTYTIYASVPNSDYENIYIPNAFTVENNIINYDLYFIAPDGPDAPVIIYLGDVPNDQGGQLELAWTPGEPREFEIFPQYSVWRLEDEWSLISTVPYHGFDLYNMVVPTRGDSTSDGIFESTFMVTAHTLDQSVFFDSQPVSGYSIDNIYPAIPQQLMANIDGESVELNWSISADEDFSYYNVYRQDQSSSESATIFATENNYYSDNIDIDGDYQYWVTAVDVSGNESDPSELAMVSLGIQGTLIPDEFALMQNYPNPFNPSTQIMYSLPKTSSVRIIIYNMLGSKVRTLHSGVQDAGYKNILWNATNDQGDPVSAGMYIYTIESESFYASKKMILLK